MTLFSVYLAHSRSDKQYGSCVCPFDNLTTSTPSSGATIPGAQLVALPTSERGKEYPLTPYYNLSGSCQLQDHATV